MSGPLVTVVTPSYNQGQFIRATIESVLSQNYPHIEYIIMDGASTDETASVVKDYASRLTFVSEKDRGQSHAINKGFRKARGRILSWLNSDDTILPGSIQKAVAAFGCKPEAGAVYGEGYQMNREGEITSRFPHTEPPNLWKLIYLSDYILQQTLYFRKDVLDDVGYLDEDLHYTMDWDLLIRIALKYPLEYIPEYLGCLREYPEGRCCAGTRGCDLLRERWFTGWIHMPRDGASAWSVALVPIGSPSLEKCNRRFEWRQVWSLATPSTTLKDCTAMAAPNRSSTTCCRRVKDRS
jgi:hypothetical protein